MQCLQAHNLAFDVRKHVIGSSYHIQIGVTQYDNALRRQPATSRVVVTSCRAFEMLAAIQLDCQLERGRVEVEYEIADDMLTQKTYTTDLSQAQPLPQPSFCRRQAAAQITRP